MKNYLVKMVYGVAAIALLVLCANLYIRIQSQKEFIERITPIVEEMDTTQSFLNYEVLQDSINNIYQDWNDDARW